MMAKTAKAGSADLIERNWNRTDLEPIMALVSQVRQGARIQADERLILFFLDFFRMGVGEQEAVAICDPLLIDLLLGHETVTPPSDAPASRRAEEERRAATAQTHYRKLFACARSGEKSSHVLVLVPFHRGPHWTLLLYDAHPSARRWLHYDSMPGSGHRLLAARFLANLAHDRLIDPPPGAQYIDVDACANSFFGTLHTTEVISVQPGGWECGFFLLMYAFRLVHDDNHRPGRRFEPLSHRVDSTFCSDDYLHAKFIPLLNVLAGLYDKHLRDHATG